MSDHSGSGYGSESDSSQGSHNSSVISSAMAPTPGHSLTHRNSRSHSPENRSRSGSRSPNGSVRRSQSRDGSSRSRSGSASGSARSRSGTPIDRSRSGSPADRSRSGSPADRSRSGSPADRSRSGTPVDRSRSGTPADRSRSGTPADRSRSGTPADRSRSGTPVDRSRSGTPRASRSRSGSPVVSRSRSRTPASVKSGEGQEKRARAAGSNSESDAEPVPAKKKKSGLIDTDESEDDAARTAGALFGDADDISSDEDEPKNRAAAVKPASVSGTPTYQRDDSDDGRRGRSSGRSDDDERRRSSDSDDGRDAKRKELAPEPEPLPERNIDVEIPRIAADLGRDVHFVKLPNFLSVDTRPFDQNTYEDEIDEEETLDEEGRQRIKLKVSNTMRWREYLDDRGEKVRESNTRIVKWSDGSMSLHLGNEIFDVYRQPLHGDHNHLFIRQGTGLQGQAVFRTKLTFRPHSTESFTHKKMTMSLADRSQKTSGIKILTQVGYDPDTDRMMNLRKEEEKLRAAMRAKTVASKSKRRPGDAAAGGAAAEHGDSDDEGAISIAAIKNRYKERGPATMGKMAGGPSGAGKLSGGNSRIYSSDDDDDSDVDARRTTRKSKSKRDSDDDDDSGSGMERVSRKRGKKKIDDSDEDD